MSRYGPVTTLFRTENLGSSVLWVQGAAVVLELSSRRGEEKMKENRQGSRWKQKRSWCSPKCSRYSAITISKHLSIAGKAKCISKWAEPIYIEYLPITVGGMNGRRCR